MKHIKVNYHNNLDTFHEDTIGNQNVFTNVQVANIFTKVLDKKKISYFLRVSGILLWRSSIKLPIQEGELVLWGSLLTNNNLTRDVKPLLTWSNVN